MWVGWAVRIDRAGAMKIGKGGPVKILYSFSNGL